MGRADRIGPDRVGALTAVQRRGEGLVGRFSLQVGDQFRLCQGKDLLRVAVAAAGELGDPVPDPGSMVDEKVPGGAFQGVAGAGEQVNELVERRLEQLGMSGADRCAGGGMVVVGEPARILGSRGEWGEVVSSCSACW